MNIIDRLIYLNVFVFAWFIRRLPQRLATTVGAAVGRLLHRTLKKRRQIAIQNLHIAFADSLSDRERQQICQEHFVNVGKTAIEFLRFPQLTHDNIWQNVSVDGKEHLLCALGQGRGAVVFIPHFGNWELLSLVFGALIPNRAKALAFPL